MNQELTPVFVHMERFPANESTMLAQMWADAAYWGAFQAMIQTGKWASEAIETAQKIGAQESADAYRQAEFRRQKYLDNLDY